MAARGGSRVAAAAWFGWLCFSQAPVFAQSAEKCVLTGTVVDSVTNAGIPHALVVLYGLLSGYRFTDASGDFQVENVQCQPQSVVVSKPGYLPQQDPSRSAGLLANPALRDAMSSDPTEQQQKPPAPAIQVVNVAPGSTPARIPLMPASSIAGTVLDENGESLAGVAVEAFSIKPSLSGPDYELTQTGRTDDRGHYALLNVAPGDYVVRLAGEASSTRYFIGSTLNLNNDHRGMQPVYYPNADSLASALVLHLTPGQRTSADFRHATQAAFNVDGRLAGLVPGAWTQMQLYRDGDRLPLGAAYVNTTSGQFRVVDVPPGSYTLRVVQFQTDPQRWLAAEAPLIVSSQPIRNLVIDLSPGADIPVSVSYEAGAQEGGIMHVILRPQHTRSNVRQLSIGKIPPSPRQADAVQSGATTQESTEPSPAALTDVIPDEYKLSVQLGVNPTEYLASAKLGDADVLKGEFAVHGNAAGELHLTIRGDSATVEGQVSLQGQPATGARVYLIPTNGRETDLRTGFAGEDGHYQVMGVPPGDYRIQAWTGSPTIKEILAKAGDTLSLQPSEHRTLALEAAKSDSPGQTFKPRL